MESLARLYTDRNTGSRTLVSRVSLLIISIIIFPGNLISSGHETYGVITGTLQLIAGLGALLNLVTVNCFVIALDLSSD